MTTKHRSCRACGAMWLACLALPACVAARADVVHALGGRLEGRVRCRAERLEVGGKAVGWGDLLFFVRDVERRGAGTLATVRLKRGEAWRVEALGLAGSALKVRFPLFGERRVELAQLASLDIVPDLPPPTGLRPLTLYREQGEPIPGKLLWLDRARLGIDSPLGVLEVPRRSALRYVLAHAPAPSPQAADDEVGLLDGTVLRGRLKPVHSGLELEHPLLGRLALPAAAVRSVLRHRPGVVYLAEAEPRAVEASPLVAAGEPPHTVVYPRADGGAPWLKGVRVAPTTALRYRLPPNAGKKRVFRAALAPLAEGRGDVRLRVAAGGRALLEKELSPGGEWPAVSVEVPAGDELIVEVSFGTRLRFPCGLTLCDPHLVVR